jgi:hypothetical protein
MTPAERVRRLVESGSVAPDEGERLLAAMREASTGKGRLALLLDPFERFGGGTAAAAGVVICLASLAASRLGARFDGLLDLHFAHEAVPLRIALLDQLAGWLLPAFGFWGYARLLSRHVRLLDFIGMAGLARLPILIAALAMYPIIASTGMPDPQKVTLTPSLLAVAVIGVACLVANVALLYKGFKNASGLAGMKLVGGFVGLVLVLEALSKIVILVLS